MSNNKISLDTNEQKASYGFGLQFGQQLAKNRFDGLDVKNVTAGIIDILEKNALQIKEVDLNAAFAAVQQSLQEKKEKQAAQIAELGLVFMRENAKREGVKTTESGLQYEILEQGTGNKPGAHAIIKTHYHGTFIDGTVFDSSINRCEPATFVITEVIQGWTEALQMMQEGAKWRIIVPSQLGYGVMGAPPQIPGGSTLVFEIHLLSIIG